MVTRIVCDGNGIACGKAPESCYAHHVSVFEIIILGLVQGLTEFLPISSSGHLVVVRMLFGISAPAGTTFDAFLHLGTLLAVLAYFWRVWRAIWQNWDLAKKLIIATIPGAIAGYFLESRLEGWLDTPVWLALGFFVSAVVLVASDWYANRVSKKETVSSFDAFLIGLVQAVALVPAISRSGITIAAGQARGLQRRQAVEFSFLMSAPIIAGAGFSSLLSLSQSHIYTSAQLFVGLLAAFIAGLAAITFLLKLIEKISFWPFAVYLVILAGVLLYVN